MAVYITAAGAFLPGEPVANDDIDSRLGPLGEGSERIRRRMLEANGIRTRHYALAEGGHLTMLNEEIASNAVEAALKERGTNIDEVGMMAVATTQPDLPVPGFASMVHGRLGGGPMELLSVGGVCCSGTAALRAVEMAVRQGEHRLGVAVASELVSRSLTAKRLLGTADEQGRIPFDAQFLRWMLSDGGGAVVVEDRPRPEGISLRIDWSYQRSHAHRYPLCMYAGVASPTGVAPGSTWQDQTTPSEADAAGMLNLRQDISVLNNIVALGVEEYVTLVRAGKLDPDRIDHLLCHYSSDYFHGDIVKLMSDAGLMIPEEKWFTNLHTKGNTGAASIFIMLEEAMRTGRFKEGDRILLMVPESGRFTVSFAHLTCVGPNDTVEEKTDTGGRWLVEELALVWAEFERLLTRVPIVNRIEAREASLEDYRRLLRNLRQQVMEGSRWITRAASSLSVEHTEIRAEFIHHAAEEQRDFQMIERDYVAVGGDLAEILGASKNVGSEALSAYMFQEASKSNPIHLLGAMYIIEGLGARKAARWADLLVEQLDLSEEQVTFLRYHGGADEEHTNMMFEMLRSPVVTPDIARAIVKTAKVVGRLYALQLEELDNA
ncbi:MAG TPA: 3-oxoacyl-[acyl-carrier-protein] synthase III C-terminal domain-containing protein [Acidimicrobiia bacterium]|nr:3-oxoacyl-[acyl-carrier-protein] synthase III C-terminal domain-containing protein [Acidimicrobiia bacterium]